MRVLHLITGLDRGGAETMLSRLVVPAEQGIEQVVFGLRAGGELAGGLRERAVEVGDLGIGPGPPRLQRCRQSIGRLRALRPDLIVSWLLHADLAAMLLAPLLHHPPVVWNLRNTVPNRVSSQHYVLPSLLAPLSSRPAAVIANSRRGLTSYLERGYHPARSLVIPNGFDVTRFRPDPQHRNTLRLELDLSSDAFVVVHVGRWHPIKDHGTLLQAFRQLADHAPHAALVLVGPRLDQHNRQLTASLDALAIGPRVRCIGPRPDVERFLAAADLLTVSSCDSEGFPNAIGEAMACGLPITTTDVGDSAEIVGDCGWIVPPGDPEALATAMLEAVRASPATRRDLGSRARRRVCDHYDLGAVRAQYFALFRQLVGIDGPPPRRT